MNKMKKFLIILIALIFASSALFAAVEGVSPKTNPDIYGALKPGFKNMDVRSYGMGGVGLVAANNAESLWLNPAGLADKKVQISVPSVGFTLYHVVPMYKAFKDGIIDNISDMSVSEIYNDPNVNQILSYGYGKILDVNSSVSFTVGGFGFGVAVQDSLHTYLDGGISSINIINQLNADIRLGYGYKFRFTDNLSLDVGATVGFNYLAYNKSVNLSTALDIINGKNDNVFDSIPMMAGWSVPINVGLRLNMPLGFAFATNLNNINGIYYMHAMDNLDSWSAAPFGNSSMKDFKFTTDMDLSIGVAWKPNWSKLFRPVVEIDFVDMIGLFSDDNISGRSWMNHLKIGTEIRTLYVLDIRAGLDSGYWTLGTSLDFYALRIDAAYYWHEFGDVAGDKGIDGLSIQINLGW